ncbi:uncharacterized protein LOC110601169 [Manihot esculenta]|uniref:Uncharacterized protein n=1 Tax=Manihot esculenta TaxID=3983 RepID=A0A2C9UHA1_MANES|nr:uncharacterized protein LOC110601169 [Manihot esculenta]OAY29570.1 hypothetical protein MANES_15G155400v8 [Manihot esculenta]
MKREGRQHGMVRTYRILPSPWNPKPNSRFINTFDSPPTAGIFSKVHPRPTNHSKFTGKCTKPRCNGCHIQPCCKSKDKTKGTEKLKSFDVASNYKLITWRVGDVRHGLKFSGFSATGILDHLDNEDYYLDDDIDEDYDNYSDHENYEENLISSSREIVGVEEIAAAASAAAAAADDDDDVEDNREDGDGDGDDGLSYCDVGFLVDQIEGDDDWCLVAEM